jgi:uncharacterized protein YidB (DUF937 family)
MSIFNKVVDQFKGSSSHKSMPGTGMAGMGAMVGGMTLLLNRFGGIGGLVQKFQEHGLGHIAQSWVGSGQNMPIEPDQLRSTLGDDTIEQVSQKAGMPSNQVTEQMCEHLPNIIDKLTPNEQIPGGPISEESISQTGVMGAVKSFLGRKAA